MMKQIRKYLEDKRIPGSAVAVAVLFLAWAVSMAAGWGVRRQESKNAETETVQETESESVAISLTEAETTLLDSLMSALEEDNLPAAAAILNNNQSQLETMLEKTLGGELCLYDGTQMTRLTEGEGLVLKKAGTVFYGSFRDGMPEGDCLALQAAVLEAPRYDYARGNWEAGHMEGDGTIGYNYYQGVQGDETREVRKEGSFVSDVMDGSLTYTSINSEGTATVWTLTADQGSTVKDDRWTYDEENGNYQLAADDAPGRVYVMTEDALKEVRWRNMILWE